VTVFLDLLGGLEPEGQTSFSVMASFPHPHVYGGLCGYTLEALKVSPKMEAGIVPSTVFDSQRRSSCDRCHESPVQVETFQRRSSQPE